MRLATGESGISFATQGATRLTISDISLQDSWTLIAKRLMTLDNLVGTCVRSEWAVSCLGERHGY